MIHSVGLLHDKHNTSYVILLNILQYIHEHYYSMDTSVVLVNITIRHYDV